MSDTAWTYTRTPADDGEPHSPAGSSAQAPHRPVTACTGLRPEVVGGMGPGEHCLHVEIEVGHDREIKRARLLCAYPNPDLIVNANQLLGLVEGEPALAQQRVEPGSFQTWLGIRGRSGRAPHCR